MPDNTHTKGSFGQDFIMFYNEAWKVKQHTSAIQIEAMIGSAYITKVAGFFAFLWFLQHDALPHSDRYLHWWFVSRVDVSFLSSRLDVSNRSILVKHRQGK